MKKRQITIKDIAKALHISPSTVSRSLADHPDISQETKNIVNAYAREHKYKPNALALSLRDVYKRQDLALAIGWLARENNIYITRKNGLLYVSNGIKSNMYY